MSASSIASSSDSAAHVVGVPRIVRRDLTAADMPPDEDNNEEVKTIIARIQTHHIRETMGTFCAKCHKQMRVTMAYKCRWCAVWYCHQCAALHFGPDTSANIMSQNENPQKAPISPAMTADLFTPIPRKTLLGVPCSALFGDCLDVMQGMDSETVDLIYIDPPYYSQADYKGDSGAFSDKWESLHQYLNWMVVRLYEMKRLLKPTGSIYLHCDWHASHYLKVEMDKIMGGECFLNDVAWLYGLGGSSPRYWPRKHDSLLWYAKQEGKHYFTADMIPATSNRMAGEMKKAPDFWDIPAVNNMAKERNGYPTQKPEALLERVIRSSCPEGGTVADFFCGSGTTAAVAQRMGRNWITCDKSQDAINLATKRIFSLPNTGDVKQ